MTAMFGTPRLRSAAPAYDDPTGTSLRDRMAAVYDAMAAREATEPARPDLAGATVQETMGNVYDYLNPDDRADAFPRAGDAASAPAGRVNWAREHLLDELARGQAWDIRPLDQDNVVRTPSVSGSRSVPELGLALENMARLRSLSLDAPDAAPHAGSAPAPHPLDIKDILEWGLKAYEMYRDIKRGRIPHRR